MDRGTVVKHWRHETDRDGLVWLTFDKQGESANTFSRQALEELSLTIKELKAASPKGLIIRSAKDGFIAGADVEEFTRFKSPAEAMSFVKLGWDVFQEVRDLPFPTTAMVNGFCMGGGVELALACKYRVALEDKARFALPEVMLGIMPAWHGVQWLPKLVGPTAAFDMLLTGKAIDGKRAKRMGLVNEAVPVRILENTARMVTLGGARQKPLAFMDKAFLNFRSFFASQARKQVAKKARQEHYPAPYAILELWKKYDGDPFAAAGDASASVESLFAHPTTANLIRIFFLQERLKNVGKDTSFQAKHVHVVGAGVMGGDIAAVCAMRGLSVTLQDTSPERIAPAIKRSADLFKRRMRNDARRQRDAMDRLIPDVTGDGARRADVIIEAIFENLEAKRSLFAKLESMAKPDAILASNTSSLKLSDIATTLKDPSRMVGIHFFNPVPLLQLVEVVSSAQTNPESAKKAAAFVRQIDKLPLPTKDAPGFLVNRVLGPYMQNAFRMIDEGTKPETIDAAMEAFGMPMGPAELADTVGLDICLHAGKSLAKGAVEVPEILEKKVALGQLGRKTGEGIYKYVDGKAQKGTPDAWTPALVESLIEPYLTEAQSAVKDGIVPDADLADAGLIFGTGFAPFRGGPLHYLQSKGGKAEAGGTASKG